ncbi:MAG TPA: 50S ribosomal protein L29 [Candidatus Saccharimonadales bacterium]|nr:50S ribosomal protein L29 [Candidatus Saccharimonadales bacterium]
MKKNLKNELKQMALESLRIRAEEIRKEMFLLRMKKFSTPEKNTALARSLRRNLACVLTFVRQKELHGSK